MINTEKGECKKIIIIYIYKELGFYVGQIQNVQSRKKSNEGEKSIFRFQSLMRVCTCLWYVDT